MSIPRRGIGSNQYSDKPSTGPSDRDVEVVRRLSEYQIPPKGYDGYQGESMVDSTRRLSTAVDKHFSAIIRSDGPEPTEESVTNSIREVAYSEDQILDRYPNRYGQAVVESVYWSVRTRYDASFASECDNDASKAARRQAFDSIYRDAVNDKRLSADELADALDIVTVRKEEDEYPDMEQERASARLINKQLALDVVSSRNYDGPSASDIAESEGTRRSANEDMLDRRMKM